MTGLSWEDRKEGRWIHLEGELDYDSYEALKESFLAAASEGDGQVIVDLAGVTFVGSQGLRLLLQAHRNLRDKGRVLAVSGMRPNVRKVFGTLGLDEAIPEWT